MKRGDVTISLITLMELVLGVLVIAVLYVTVHGLVSNSPFFQQFFAKDNAHLIEAMHAVPNGEMHIGYLWDTPDFQATFTSQDVSVSKMLGEGDKRIPGEGIKKSFGKSTALAFGTTENEKRYSFEPQYYEYVLSGVQTRSLIINQRFNEINCPGTQYQFSQVRISAIGKGVNDAEQFARTVQENVRVELNGKPGQAQPSIALILTNTDHPQAAVYYTHLDDGTVRLACTLAVALSGQENARYGHISQATEDIQGAQGDIVVVLRTPKEQLGTYTQKLVDGIAAATQVHDG